MQAPSIAVTALVVFGLALVGALAAGDLGGDRLRAGVDCNGNGVPDAQDIAGGTSEDCEGNGVPDECDVEPTFTPAVITTSFAGPWSLHVADLDGDDRPDVLIGSLLDDTVSWSRNLGPGGFAPPLVIDGAVDGVRSVFAADFDGDGDLDVLSASSLAGGVYWYENLDGLGAFGLKQLVSGVKAWALHAADLDGDADPDVVLAAVFEDRVEWLANVGGGAFELVQVLSVDPDSPFSGEDGPVVDPHDVIVVDVDGDGDGDIVTASAGDGQIAWFANDGSGTFGDRQSVTFAAKVAERVAAADLDGDGDFDLLSASPGKIAWYPNFDGAGAFGPERVLSVTASGASSVAALDLDGDGDPDVVSAAPDDNTIAWYENLDGDGNFGAEQLVSTNATQVVTVTGGDLDADGDIDLVAALHGFAGSDCCEDNPGTGCNDTACQNIICGQDPYCCDVDWDQICADQALADPTCVAGCNGGGGRVIWFRNGSDDCTGNGTPDECEPDCNGNGLADVCEVDCNGNGLADSCDLGIGASDDCDGNGVPDECQPDCNANAVADACDIAGGTSDDCTGDGVPDECQPDCNANSVADVCDIAGGTSEDCTGNGVPDECEGDCNANGTADSCDVRGGASDDCDGDGIPDECQPDCNANTVADTCDTQLQFTAMPIADDTFSVRSMFAADLDGDADMDLVSGRKNADTIVWHPNVGVGTFAPPVTITVEVNQPLAVSVADLDGDDDLDVLSASFSDDTVAWYENVTPTFWFQHIVSAQINNAAAVEAADLDGDGDHDVVAASSFGGLIVWFENLDGQGNFGPKQAVGTVFAGSVRAADVDGDGDRDLAFGSPLGWHENVDGQGAFTSEHLVVGGEGFGGLVPADVDGDGDVDLMATDGVSTLAWFANADGLGSFSGPQTISTAADNVYSVFAADVDGDGDVDALSASLDDRKIAWYPNVDGAGTFGPQRILDLVPGQATVVLAADIDGDGTTDPISADFQGALTWYRNESGDCDANGVPDTCEPDCNNNGIADACDLRASGFDCNANGQLDECDTGCSGACDADGDGCQDALDAAPDDPLVCGDTDGDGCDDCSSGVFAPNDDGRDGDGDGHCDSADCAPVDGETWRTPGPAQDLRLRREAGGFALSWSPPEVPGAVQPFYDLLRSESAATFAPAVCIEADDTDTAASDSTPPQLGGVHHYLVRVENACGSAMGVDSSGEPHDGPPCD